MDVRIPVTSDTIVARSTPIGRGAIGVIRLSGPESASIVEKTIRTRGASPVTRPRCLVRGWLVEASGNRLDEVLVVFFSSPASYTGQDMAEVHCHGGLAVTQAVLDRLLEAGARPALPGEFTRRALENGKLDLSRAEAVARLIDAQTREQVRGAAEALRGAIEKVARDVRDGLVDVLARIEAQIEFPEEEDVSKEPNVSMTPWIDQVRDLKRRIRKTTETGSEVVFCGRPNVGKSSLINAMVGKQVSIVTEEPGTTRDAVCADITLEGLKVRLVDTAGQREVEELGVVEKEASRVAREKVAQAALVVWVTEVGQEREPPPWIGSNVIKVINKSDLLSSTEQIHTEKRNHDKGWLYSCAHTGEGVDQLESKIQRTLIEALGPADGIPVSCRQLDAIRRVMTAGQRAKGAILDRQPELAAEDLREAIEGLNELLGEQVELDVLERIFSEFCIGK
jgi:tRNA modification GTPase